MNKLMLTLAVAVLGLCVTLAVNGCFDIFYWLKR